MGASDTELQIPWSFLGDKNVFCSNEATLGGLLNSFRMGAGHWKNQAMIRSLEIQASSPHFLEMREGRGAGNGVNN